MTTVFSVIPLIVRRVIANARLMTAVVIGAVLASALMSTTSIYTDAIQELGLSYAVRKEGPDRTNILVRSTSQVSQPEIYQRTRDFIADSSKQALGPLLAGQNYAGRSATFFPTPPGGLVSAAEDRPRSHLQFLTDLQAHIRVVAGTFPAETPSTGNFAPSIEVAIGAATAQRLGLKIGDRFDLHPFWRPDVQPVGATIVGLIEPTDLSETYWLGLTDFFNFTSERWPTYPLFVAERTYFDAVANYLQSMSSDYWTLSYLNAGRIDVKNAPNALVALENLDRVLTTNVERTTTTSQLPEVLRTFSEKLFFTRIPLLVLLLQMSGIVLYYLFMVSTMLVERQSSEISLFKSRGATTGQVMHIYAIEGIAIALVALIAGPPLAALVISVLGKTPMFSDLSAGSYLTVRLTGSAYLWALSGALLAYATLLWPAYQATKRTVVQYRTQSARPPQEPVFTRYYLDVALVGLGALLFYQLNRRGTLVTEKLFGEQSADPVSLLTPAFFILTVGIVFLRIFPLVLKLASLLVARAQGTAVLIGMWQLVRNPVHYSRLVLLLMLATAVGMFAASFGATLERSYEDRAAYVSGSGLRLEEVRRADVGGPNSLATELGSRYAASASSLTLRSRASAGTAFERTDVQVLGIDPASFSDVAYYRDDFSPDTLSALLGRLAEDNEPAPGIVLPAGARWIGMWVRPDDLNGRVGVDIRVLDSSGRYFFYTLGPDGGAELSPSWSFVAADLTRPLATGFTFFPEAAPRGPLTMQTVSIHFFSRASANNGAVQFDEIQTSGTATLPPELSATRLVSSPDRTFRGLTTATVVADFENVSNWEILTGMVADPLPDEIRQTGDSGSFAARLSWRPVRGQPQTHGMRVRGEGRAVPAFASESFVAQTGAGVGSTSTLYMNGAYVDFEIIGIFDLFPTLADTRNEPSLVANEGRLSTAVNRVPRSPQVYADEVWLKPGPDSARLAAADMEAGAVIATVFDFEDLREAQQRDPLIAASWEGILFLSFAAVLLLSAIGFLIYSYLTAQKRTLEFAVLRTMGFSRRQIATVVGFEQVFVIGLGMLAGSLMGLRLGSLMIRYMGITETGDSVLPPMLLHVSWFTAFTALAVLAAVFVVTIGVVILMYSRLALHRVLRIGET